MFAFFPLAVIPTVLLMVVMSMVSIALLSHVDGYSSLPALRQRRSMSYASFHSSMQVSERKKSSALSAEDDGDDGFVNSERMENHMDRRLLLKTIIPMTTVGLLSPRRSWAGIDVSGLQVEGGGGAGRKAVSSSPNTALQQQLRAYDGSGSARIQQLQDMKSTSSTPPSTASSTTATTTTAAGTGDDTLSSAATYAYRYNPGVQPQLKKVGLAGERYRYQDALATASKSPSSSRGYLNLQFEFPSDWLQLDRVLGGIQYVDQRNGDKLLVLKSPIPDGESLITVPKQWFAQTIFDPKGTIVATTGIEVDEFKASKSTVLNDGISTSTSPHRRLLLKYSTVTPNGLRTERRGLVDAYEINNVAYMMFTGSNAVKFDKGGPERETVERIVDSFVVEAIR